MSITINGSGTLTGVSVGGLPDGIVDADTLATNAVTTAKINDNAVTDAKEDLTGAARAWCFFNSLGTIQKSYNVSSITDSAAGRRDLNYTNALSDSNYVVVIGLENNMTDTPWVSSKTTGGCRTNVFTGGSFTDQAVHVVVFCPE